MKAKDIAILAYLAAFLFMMCNLFVGAYICAGICGIAFWIAIQ